MFGSVCKYAERQKVLTNIEEYCKAPQVLYSPPRMDLAVHKNHYYFTQSTASRPQQKIITGQMHCFLGLLCF